MKYLSSIKTNFTPMGIDTNSYINDELKRKDTFSKCLLLINDVENIFLLEDIYHDIMHNSNDDDIIFYINGIKNIKEINDTGLWNLLRLMDVIINRIYKSDKIKSCYVAELDKIIENIDSALYDNKYDNDDLLSEFNILAEKYEKFKNIIQNRPCRPLFIAKAYLCEGAMDPDGNIKSTIYDGKNPDDIIKEIYDVEHDEWLIEKIDRIYDYYAMCMDKLSTPSSTKPAYSIAELNTLVMIAYVYKNMALNITGMINLDHTINKILEIVPDDRLSFIGVLREISSYIHEVINDEDKSFMMDDSPLHALGLGDIYKYLPDKEDGDYNIPVQELNESINNNYDSMCVLSESIFSERRSVSKERISNDIKDEHRRKMLELRDKRLADEYDIRNSQKRTDAFIDIDDKRESARLKRDLKRRKKEAALEEKLKDKAAKAETKRKLREEKRENNNRNGKLVTIKDKFNTEKYTNYSLYKLTRALNRMITAVAAGGVGVLAGINPAFLGVLAVLKKRLKQGGKTERAELYAGIRDQLELIRKKKEIAERNNDTKTVLELEKMETKLDRMYTNVAYNMPHQDKLF